jgi:UDP-glucose 4-epimerase
VITGVSGLVGFHLAEELCISRPDLEVVGICRSHGRNVQDLQLHPNFRFVAADILEPSGYERELEGTGTLYHLAAQSAVFKGRLDPLSDLRINVQGTLQLALCAAAAGVQKLVFTSGGAVYAGQDRVSEDQVRQPPSVYGASKLAAESYLRVIGETKGLSYTVLRLSRVYGPRMTRGALWDLAQDFQAGHAADMFAHPDSTFDFIYVRDVVDALLLAARPEWDGATANISSAVGTGLRDLHARFEAMTGRTIPLKPRDGAPVVETLLNDRARALGWVPRYTLDAGMAETLAWLLPDLCDQGSAKKQP